MVWVSFSQLYLDYQMTPGNPGPLRVQGLWVDKAHRQYLDAEKFDNRQRTKWFRQFLKKLLTAANVTFTLAQCRPKSDSIQAYVQAIALLWCPRSLYEVEKLLTSTLTAPCVRNADVLRHLPLIDQRETMVLSS